MSFQIQSYEFAETMEQTEIDYMVDRMHAIRERPGNPMGIEIMKFGGATAFFSKEMPWPQFNTVKGISLDDLHVLDEIIEFYRSRGSRLQFEIIPTKAKKELMKVLFERAFYQSDFHATLYGHPFEMSMSDGPITIRELEADEINLYAEIHCLGTGLSLSGMSYVADNNRVLLNREGWRFFVALVEGTPAGVGVMYMNDGLASLTFATTLHEYRNKGVQKALLERRITEASRNNCKFIISQAAYASTSFRNMERSGMRLGYTRATWIKG
ncbi:GNAT family N-acetyltransferase [Paenibacillus sp. LMG 31456]|uniref:GNAT family N-acetyltransferase n=1 Tax=Paenibacillus foliorum TaxID=2654974 RepID=A0A972GU74_9BACL|nr:GNAT family N-acetyltransferase [Paenibacillus foliorum]NOU94278.1 GNAT family N-acetyltransferase [Paenibacillus foliorum]